MTRPTPKIKLRSIRGGIKYPKKIEGTKKEGGTRILLNVQTLRDKIMTTIVYPFYKLEGTIVSEV